MATRSVSLHRARCLSDQRLVLDSSGGGTEVDVAANVPLVVVSKRLGHSGIALTADTYSHLLKGVDRQAAEGAAALLPCQFPHQSRRWRTGDCRQVSGFVPVWVSRRRRCGRGAR